MRKDIFLLRVPQSSRNFHLYNMLTLKTNNWQPKNSSTIFIAQIVRRKMCVLVLVQFQYSSQIAILTYKYRSNYHIIKNPASEIFSLFAKFTR